MGRIQAIIEEQIFIVGSSIRSINEKLESSRDLQLGICVMEKETKRLLQLILEIIQEQQNAIWTLQQQNQPSARASRDAIADRVERRAQEVRDLKSFKLAG